MCGRFTLRNAEQLPLRFDATASPEVKAALVPYYNIAPTQPIPIVIVEQSGQRQITLASWGLTPRRATGKSFLAFNARAETLTERPLFRGLLPKSRCLIPGDGFIEWAKAGKARDPYFFALTNGEIFAFAGLLDRWVDGAGQEYAACTIITTAPNALVANIHDRMPVILPRDEEGTWLDPQASVGGDLLPLLTAYPERAMNSWPLDRAINSSHQDAPELLQAIH